MWLQRFAKFWSVTCWHETLGIKKKNKHTYWQSWGRQLGVCQAQNVRAHTAPSAPVTVWAWSCFEASAVATFACITYNIRASEKGEAPSRLQPPPLSGTLPLMRGWVQHSETFLLIRSGMRSSTNLKDKRGKAVMRIRRRRLMCKSSADVFPCRDAGK